ncbi:P-loop containing nucleoside triphosphate hydrolase protein [Panaeolus papilionaceus]|nr:P-loop containing nucleoside triphosphate hydrolase protein [Panaeolus papilionaceus]
MSSARPKQRIDPFMMMGTGFKDLDESRFMKGTKAHKVAFDRLTNRTAQVPQPTPPGSDEDSGSEASVVPSAVFPQSPPRPARVPQRASSHEAISATVISHQRREKADTRVLQQRTASLFPTGLSTPPATERKKVVRMVRASTGAIVSKEIEIKAPQQQRPIPAPNFEFQSPPAFTKKQARGVPKTQQAVKKQLDSDDDYVHLRVPLRAPGNSNQSAAIVKPDLDDLENPFKVFQPVVPNLSPFTRKKSESVSSTVKHEHDAATFGSHVYTPLKAEGRTYEDKAQVAPRWQVPSHGLATPETTPTKQGVAYSGSSGSYASRFPQVIIDGRDLISRLSPEDPYQKKPIDNYGPFRSLPAKPVKFLRLTTPPPTGKNSPLPVYMTDNGDTLDWYQAFDVEDMVAETVAREVMRMEKDSLLYDVPQGKILAYQMGMGKTHVALSVIAETFSQTQALYKRHKLKFTRKPVLIVAEKSLQSQWAMHAKSLFGLKVAVYSDNYQDIPSDADVVIVNIVLLRNQHKQKIVDEGTPIQNAKKTPFFDTTFSYLVVDEFHQYSNPTTLSACALLNIKADSVLLLSGTPAQNKLDDLQLPVALLQHPIKRKNFRAIERALRKAKKEKDLKPQDIVDNHDVNDKVLIEQVFITRRILDGYDGIPALSLPHRIDNIVQIELTAIEYSLHRHMYARETGFVRFLRCRQASLDPRLLLDSGVLEEPAGAEIRSKDVEDVTDEFDALMTNVESYPCEQPPSYDAAAKAALIDLTEVLQDDYIPSKTRVALQLLRNFRKKGEKALIFSNFTMLLRRLSDALEDHGVGHTFYHGKMDRNQRDKALSTLANEDECSVMLVSIKAGGLGLNITTANNIIIMDPWWNPFVEEQAIARVYRIGQTRPVEVFRLIAPDTVENRMVETQERKRTEITTFLDRTASIMKGRDKRRFSILLRPLIAQQQFNEATPKKSFMTEKLRETDWTYAWARR